MLYDYFSLYLYIIEGLRMSTSIIYANTLNNKEDYNNYSDYKLGNSLLDYLIEN